MKNSNLQNSREIGVKNLSCTRGERTILSGMSFEANPGEAVVLRGPNGAGKSTLLMCLAGLLPFEGHISVTGRSEDAHAGEDMHFISHLAALKPSLSVAANLAFWANLNGGDAGKIPTALVSARLEHATDLDAGDLSAGQTRRLSLCRLLVTPRPIWLLDEPTAALDAQGEKWIRGLIDTHLAQNGIAIIATHLDLLLAQKPSVIRIGKDRQEGHAA